MLADSRVRAVRRSSARVRTGLFETDADVRAYVRAVDVRVRTLQANMIAWAVKKWGPNGFAASVTAAQLKDFQADKAFYAAWATWRDNWDVYRQGIEDAWFIVKSADTYRDVQKYDLEQQAWRQKFIARGGEATDVTPTNPGTIPGVTPPSNPDAPKQKGWFDDIPWTGIAIVAGIAATGYVINGLRK